MTYQVKIKKSILFLIITGCLLPFFSFAQIHSAGPPQSLEELKTAGLRALKFIPETSEKICQETTGWLKKIWQSYIYPFLHKIWQKIDSLFGKEIEQRKPIIKEEFKKETEEMKEELPLVTKSLWEKLKELLK